MIEVEPLEKALTLSLQSAYIKNNTRAVSLLIIADAEHGKTQTMYAICRKLVKKQRIFFTNNVTAKYIEKELLHDIKEGKIKHIVIPDLLNSIERARSTRQLFVNFMKSLIDEGIVHVADAYGQFQHAEPVKCGLISAITKANLNENYGDWRNIGFLSRMIPFSYRYDIAKVMKIFDNVFKDQETRNNGFPPIKLKEKEIADGVEYSKLQAFSMTTARSMQGIGVRMYENLVGLARANAYFSGRQKTNVNDVEEVMRLSKWFNYEYNVL